MASSSTTSLPYWLHCNYCLKFNNNTDTRFNVASCGHIGCDTCAEKRMSPVCCKCKKKTSKPRPIDQLPPSHTFLFADFYQTLEEEHKNFLDILTFHRDQWRSQYQHRRRKLQAAKDALTKPDDSKSAVSLSRDKTHSSLSTNRDKMSKQRMYEQAVKNSRIAASSVKDATDRVTAVKKMNINQFLAKNTTIL